MNVKATLKSEQGRQILKWAAVPNPYGDNTADTGQRGVHASIKRISGNYGILHYADCI